MKPQINKIQTQLETEKTRLENLLGDFLGTGIDDIRESTVYGKREEIVTAFSDFEMNNVNINKTRDRLQEIERALVKITDDSYGFCDICGATIPRQRLEALPQTNVCLPCKTKNPSKNNAL